MKYKVINIERGDCSHKMWDITCKRHRELMDGMDKITTKLTKSFDRGKATEHAIEGYMRQLLELAETDGEAFYIVGTVYQQAGVLGGEDAMEELGGKDFGGEDLKN